MAKKEGSKKEKELFAELKKLAKRTNQRILRLERLTGYVEGFAVKQLYDYLTAEPLQAITKTKRVAVRKTFSEIQMRAIINTMKRFLSNETSTQRGLKKYIKNISKEVGFTLTFEQANTQYQAEKNYKWIYDYMTPSEFWDFARESVSEKWNQNQFIDMIQVYIDEDKIDKNLHNKLVNLYKYAKDVNK